MKRENIPKHRTKVAGAKELAIDVEKSCAANGVGEDNERVRSLAFAVHALAEVVGVLLDGASK